MKKIYNNKVVRISLLLSITFFLIEVLFRIIMQFSIFDISLLRIFLFDVILSLFLSLFLSFLKNIYSNIIISIILVIFACAAIFQGGMYNYLGTFMSFNVSSQAGAIGDYVGDFFRSLNPFLYTILLISLFFTLYLIFIEKKVILNNKKNISYEKSRIISCIIILICSFLYYLTISLDFLQNETQIISNKELFSNPSIPNITLNQYGILGYEFIDIKSIILPSKEEVLTFVKDNTEEEEVTDYTREIDDTTWEAAASSETDTTYQTLNSYFLSKDITSKNDYTGLFKGKNLIVIMIESGSNVLLDYPEYFPNINKLYNEGWSWDNAFSPRNSCSTGNNEMTGMTSLYTINNTCTVNIYKDNTYFEAIFNLFNNANYTTSSYHDYNDHFYYRSIYHPNMGSEAYFDVTKLGITLDNSYQAWPSDVEFIEKALPNFVNEDQFMVWLTTVSSHMRYNVESTTGNMYLDLFQNEDWSISAKRYMSKLKIVDNAIGTLLSGLEEAGKLEDTVIMLFADHYPYGLGDDDFASLAKYDITSNSDIDRTPFIIYNPTLTPSKYEDYTTFVNILPTLANLFDLDYDPRLYAGTDLLSEDYSGIVVFADGSWRTSIAYYDATNGKINYTGEVTYTAEEINEINTKVKNEMQMDNLAIKSNYFAYLENILSTKEEND